MSTTMTIGVAFNQRHVGDAEAAHLIDAVADLEQAVIHVELRLPPQARVDGRRCGGGCEKTVRLQVQTVRPCALATVASGKVSMKLRSASS